MNRKEHLLTIFSEECSEIAQRVSKALRFGLQEVQKGQEATNAERIVYEFSDLLAVYEMLFNEGILPNVDDYDLTEKQEKVEKYLLLSEAEGTLKPDLQELLERPLTPEECFKGYECDRCGKVHNPQEQEVIEMQWYEEPHGCMGGDCLHHDHYFFYCECDRPIEIEYKDIPDSQFKDMTKTKKSHGRGRCIKNVKGRM